MNVRSGKMSHSRQLTSGAVVVVTLVLLMSSFAVAQASPHAVLWSDPGSIGARDLFYGPLGKDGAPKMPVRFVSEDRKQGSPKFDLKDAEGRKWRAKVGPEAQPETVATRLLWAMGYFTNENVLVAELPVAGLPPKLHRGREYVGPNGVRNVRLQARTDRSGEKTKSDGKWEWKKNPFLGTREFNGLRVMMALVSNWDLTTANTGIRQSKDGAEIYEVSDVGASFGKPGAGFRQATSKNNLKAYERAKFIHKVTPDYVDFNFPKKPPLFYFFEGPKTYHWLAEPHWIGQHVPRADVKWIASLLAQLSEAQIRDAFRAANYQPQEIDAFTRAVEKRIAELKSIGE